MSDYLYNFNDLTMQNPSNDHFCLHAHSAYEIFLFIEGDSRYIVEDKSYDLSPGDIIVIRKHEMHRVFQDSNKLYRRVVMMVSQDFFKEFNCPQYEDVFLPSGSKLGNKINAEIVRSSGLYDAIMRMKKYTKDFKEPYTAISNSIMIEILHIINQVSLFQVAESSNKTIENIIHYINNHFTEKINLDILCDKFYVSKYYLCHIFKKSTGLTVHEYIKQKRLALCDDFVRSGKTLTESALLSGFSDYSSFYRAYTKHNNQAPKSRK